MIEFTREELKLIRKALQCVSLAHTVVETEEGTLDRETPIDYLISKIRRFEEGETDGIIQSEADSKTD